MSATTIVVLPPGEQEELRTAFRFARGKNKFGKWQGCKPGTEEKDEYDDTAVYVLAINERKEIIFGVRVITKTQELPLPIERYVPGINPPVDSVEFSRALRVRFSPTMDATRIYRLLFKMYHTAPETYASIHKEFKASLLLQFGQFMRVLPARPFRKGKDVFVPVEFLVEEARQALFSASNEEHQISRAA